MRPLLLALLLGAAVVLPVSADPMEGVDLKTTPRITLPPGTPLKLVLLEHLYSQRNEEGDEVVFALAEDVVLLDTTYLIKGTPVLGRITNQKAAQSWGRAGSLDVEVASIIPPYGLPIVITDNYSESGSTNIGKVVVNYLVWGGVFGGAVKGKKINIPAGTEITLFTGADGTVLDLSTEQKQSMLDTWYTAKVRSNFKQFDWDRADVTKAFAMEGITLTDDMITVQKGGDYDYVVEVASSGDAPYRFEFQAFEDAHTETEIGLKASNESAQVIIDHLLAKD